jgi:hypothetical protein
MLAAASFDFDFWARVGAGFPVAPSGSCPRAVSRSIRSATAFRDRNRALAFERYLKSGSGRAFLHRHL